MSNWLNKNKIKIKELHILYEQLFSNDSIDNEVKKHSKKNPIYLHTLWSTRYCACLKVNNTCVIKI